MNNVIKRNVNVNSISSKFDDLKVLTKLHNTSPVSQFHIDEFSIPCRLDRNKEGSGAIVYVREDIPSKLLSKHSFKGTLKDYLLKLILGGIYHPPSQLGQYFFSSLDKLLDIYCNYKKVVLVGDFNAKIGLGNFLFQHELKNINKEPTCFINAHNQSCKDNILSNSPESFVKTDTLFT